MNKIVTHIEALEKAKAYCAYQERCHQEVQEKLKKWNLTIDEKDYVVLELMRENYLNEERFAKAFVSGKFRIKKWGRMKIKQHLKAKKVSAKCIEIGMKEIDPSEYYGTLCDLIERKWRESEGKPFLQRKSKLWRYLYSRGYESNLIQEAFSDLIES